MLQTLLGKLFNRNSRLQKVNTDHLARIQQCKNDLGSPSKGIVEISHSLYNFLKEDYIPFSLNKHSDGLGISFDTYTGHSNELLDFMRNIYKFPETQYLQEIKSIREKFPLATSMFLDWYDNDESINKVMQEFYPDILLIFLFFNHQDDDSGEMQNDVYLEKVDYVEKLLRRYPGLEHFVQLRDYHNLLAEILNVLIVLYTINLRSLGETSQNKK